MYLNRIQLHNIRCFKQLDINLSHDDPRGHWLILLGDNGTGKTTVLRSIAIGMCDETGASALIKELPGDMLRIGETKGFIRLEFIDTHETRKKPMWIKTCLEQERSTLHVTQTTSQEFPRKRPFACGYGAARRAYGSQDYNKYSLVDSVYTLFNYDQPLQNPELCLRRISSQKIPIAKLTRLFDDVLMLPAGSTRLKLSGIQIKGPWGDSVTLGAISDGYASTIGWLADMLGWVLFFDRTMLRGKIRGIILVDELEQHLHPSWQREIVRLLNARLPDVQFIVTSHSPLVAIGATVLDNKTCEFAILEHVRDYADSRQEDSPPRSQRADQVLTSRLFRLESTTGFDIPTYIARYQTLRRKAKLTGTERQEQKKLGKMIDLLFGPTETDSVRKILSILEKQLQRGRKQAVRPATVSTNVDKELVRRIRNLVDSLKSLHDKD